MCQKIIKVKSKHIPRIHELNQSALPAVSSVTEEELTHFLEISDYFRIIIKEKKIVGFLIAMTPGKNYGSSNYKWFEKHYKHFMYIDRVVIDPAFRGRGFGKEFYNDLSAFSLLFTHIISCEVNIKPKNNASLIFHAKYGFKSVGTQKTENGKKTVSLMICQII